MGMTQTAGMILAKAAAYDGRKAGSPDEQRLTVQAWAEALHPDTTVEDGMRAVTEHYASSSDWLMASHVNRLTAKYRADRLNLDTLVIPVPDGLGDEPATEIAWQAAWLTAIKAGDSPNTATTKAWAAIGRTVPREIESTQKHDVKSALEDFKRRFGRKN